MPIQFDHLIIAVDDLDKATEDYKKLGFNVKFGGVHASGATHNALICFQDGTYIELLAPTGNPPQSDEADFTSWLEDGEGFVGYALICGDLDKFVAGMRERGVSTVGDAKPGGRARPDGVEIKWKSAFVGDRRSPFFIEDLTERNLRVPDDTETTTHPNAVTGIMCVGFCTDDNAAWISEYEQWLGIKASPHIEPGFILEKATLLTVECNKTEAEGVGDRPVRLLLNASRETDYSQPTTLDLTLAHNANISISVPGQHK